MGPGAPHDRGIVGGGVLVPGNRVLTCAHVVTSALDTPPVLPAPAAEGASLPVDGPRGPAAPTHPVTVEIPRGDRYHPATARVIPDTWEPERDTVLLLLDEDTPYTPAPLSPGLEALPASRPVSITGYALDLPAGQRVRASVAGRGGDRPGRVQLHIGREESARVEPGFSGCGVLDVENGEVIGIVTSIREAPGPEANRRTAFMEPVDSVAALAAQVADSPLARVRTVLSGLGLPAASHAYHYATHDRYGLAAEHGFHPIRAFTDFSTPWDAFIYLRELSPREDGMPREILYLVDIAQRGVANADPLWDYVHSRPVWEVPKRVLAELRSSRRPPAPPNWALIISADSIPGDARPDGPTPGRSGRYVLTSWVDRGEGPSRRSSTEISRAELRSTVLRLIEETEAEVWTVSPRATQPFSLRLRLVLPFELLIRPGPVPVSRWRRPVPVGRGPQLGAANEITFHCRERLADAEWLGARHRLDHRWRTLRQRLQGRIHTVPPAEGRSAAPALPNVLAASDIVMCVLSADPGGSPAEHGAPDRTGPEEELSEGGAQLAAALLSGLPVIAWNGTADPEDARLLQNRMRNHLRDGGETIAADEVASLPYHLRLWCTRHGVQPAVRPSKGSPDGSAYSEAGHDPFDIKVILDEGTYLSGLFSDGVYSPPR